MFLPGLRKKLAFTLKITFGKLPKQEGKSSSTQGKFDQAQGTGHTWTELRNKGALITRVEAVVIDVDSICGDIELRRHVLDLGTCARHVEVHRLVVIVVLHIHVLDGDGGAGQTRVEAGGLQYLGSENSGRQSSEEEKREQR